MTGSEPLPGRHALVTGALSGVRLVSRTTGPMDQSVAATRNSVGVARSVVLEVRDSDALPSLVEQVVDVAGVDVMVNAAGLERPARFLDGAPTLASLARRSSL